MNNPRPIVVVLIAIAAVGGSGAVHNVIRISADRQARDAAATTTRAVIHDATLSEAVWAPKVDSLRELLGELERSERHTAPNASLTGAELQASARELGADILRFDSDPARGILSVSVSGDEAKAYQWLEGVEQAMQRDGALLENLIITAEPDSRLAMTIEIRYPGEDASPPVPGGLSRSRLALASQAWPDATVQAVAAAFTSRSTPTVPNADIPSTVLPADTNGHRTRSSAGRVELVGIASVNGVQRYVLRFNEERSVQTLQSGEQAFGWRLVGSGGEDLVLQKEGEYYAIPD
jgi:hypothetical protein